MNFGDKIKKLRQEKKMSQYEIATKLDISVGALSRYECGMYEPKSLSIVCRFAELYNVSTDYLLGYSQHGNQDTTQSATKISVYSKITAQNPFTENIIGHIFISARSNNNDTYFALELNNDTMNQIIPQGSRVIAKRQTTLKNGEIGVIIINANDAIIARYEQDEDNVYLFFESNNTKHRVQRYALKNNSISILGKVQSYSKELL